MPRLSKRFVDATKPPSKREVIHYDDEILGLGLRVRANGTKVFLLRFRNRSGIQRKLILGRVGAITPHQARELARARLAEVAQGGDPVANRRETREAPTVRTLAERYMEEHVRPLLAPKTAFAALGQKKVAAVTTADVARFHRSMRHIPTGANRVIAAVSKMFSLAEVWGLRPRGSNPVHGVQRFKENRRERFLSAQELTRLGAVLAEPGLNPFAVAAVRLLLLTGCRLGEVLTLKWEYVDFERSCLRLPASKTGAKVVSLGAAARELLASIPRVEGNPYVIVGELPGAHFVGLPRVWYGVLRRAGLTGVRLHDLRHSFASFGVAGGESLFIVGRLLGHAGVGMTARYAHLSADPLRAAADRISGEIAASLAGTGEAQVVAWRAQGRVA